MPMTVWEDKVALLTGAGREPVRSLAARLAQAGACLALNDLAPMGLEETAARAALAPQRVSLHVADPSKGMAARALLDEVYERWGRVDLLVCAPRAEPRANLFDLDEWDFLRAFESNVSAPFLLLQNLARGWRADGLPGQALLLAADGDAPALRVSMAALDALARAAAADMASSAIRVRAVSLAALPADPAAAAAALFDLVSESQGRQA